MNIRDSNELFGLVLAGGQSSRMGMDKGLLKYHQNLPQRIYLHKLLSRFCAKTFLGLRQDQQQEEKEFPLILDNENYQGPFKSILAAHEAHPAQAWLVVACDLPFLTDATIQKLVRERDSAKIATAYYNPQQDFPEPLLTIWEPEGLKLAKDYAATGNYSPGKFLKSGDYKKVPATHGQELLNVNRKDEYEQAKRWINDSQ